ncbi:MAG: hypothetical protein F2735_07095 [Actinobacteria bacterium]|jgi:hypothetical protein|uniref:Unannotated protein n=1 Tax=freshwater metagenome TaxID=449393 RepID=A0A6J6YIF3_9ZZZZ|nr:hypothetical protein [Actinomycetota bacterium]
MKSALPRLLIVAASGLFGISACSSSDSSDTPAAGSASVVTAVGTDDQVIEQFSQVWVGQAGAAGFAANQACVMTVAAKLDTADVQKLRENINLPELSSAGQALLDDGLGKCLAVPATTTTNTP